MQQVTEECMVKSNNKLNDASGSVIEENFLKQNPEGFSDAPSIVATNQMPKYVKATFLNNRDPGVALHFHYHSKTHPIKHYTLYHGSEHLLPEEIIDHLENCSEPQYAYRKNPEGHQEHYISGYKYIFSFRNKRNVA